MIWFTSDWHLGHANIIKFCHRPFLNTDEMDRSIVENFFKVVHEGDIVFYLGDLAFRKKIAQNFLKMIPKGIQFHFVRGNHDQRIKNSLLAEYCTSFTDGYKEIHINEDGTLGSTKARDGMNITLCHYPMHSWNHSHYGSWMIHGHHHADTRNQFPGKILNVSVDNWHFQPVSLTEVKHYMVEREVNWDDLSRRANNGDRS